jgi:hypothetical protein
LIEVGDERMNEMKQMSGNPQHQLEVAESTEEVSRLKLTLFEGAQKKPSSKIEGG